MQPLPLISRNFLIVNYLFRYLAFLVCRKWRRVTCPQVLHQVVDNLISHVVITGEVIDEQPEGLIVFGIVSGI